MKFQIKLKSVEDAVCLVHKLEKYDWDADALVGKSMVDAKSFLGLIGLGIGKRIDLMVYVDMDNKLENDIHEFLVA